MDRRTMLLGSMANGLGRPAPSRFPYPGRPESGPGLGANSSAAVRTRRLIVFGVEDGVFIYNGIPALGNPPVLWGTAPGTTQDPYGNPLPQTGFVSRNNGTGQMSQLLAGQLALYPGVAGSLPSTLVAFNGELLINSGQQPGGTDAAALIKPFSKLAGGLGVPLLSLDVQTALNATGGGAVPVINNSGLSGFVSPTKTDTSTNANANSGTLPLTVAWTINAADAKVGTTYEVEVPFNGVFENQSLGFVPSLNGSTVATSGGDTIGGAFFGLGTGFAGLVTLKVRIITTGALGTADFFVDGGIGINGNRSSGTNNNNGYLSSQATAVAFNTTVANTIGIDSVWGGSTAGQTVTGHGSEFTRKGP